MRKMKKIMYLSLVVLLACVLVGCTKKEAKTYTYNYAASVFPTNWNPHTYQTATDADILGYTESGFYTFDYNETKDGYQVVPAMAKSEPQDVTADYVGEEWGIEEGETGRVYKIDLKDNLEWEDGTKINATSFVESAKRLLAPEADNYRADSLYNGNLVIANAKEYYYQGEEDLYPSTTAYTEYPADGSLDGELIFTLSEPVEEHNNQEVPFRTMMGFPASYDAVACADYVIKNYLPDSAFNAETAAAMEGKTLAEIKADATLKAAWEALISWWQTEPNEELHFFLANYSWPEVAWENVGIFEEDGDLVLVLEKPLKGFYLLYSLTGSWLVHEETYDNCISYTTDGIYVNTYGTSAANFKSYGPYKLTYFEAEKEYRFEKNENWYGYDEAENKGLYQTTNIVCKYIAEAATRLQEFEKGNLDSYGLSASDMEKFISSSDLYYTEGASTFFIALNPLKEGLETAQKTAGENINKTILTILEFRQALSFAVDRVQFCLACDPTGKPSKSVFNNLIISDPENGTAYRTNEEAKDVVLAFWGLTDQVGEGKRFATKDAAIASITGVDLAQAKVKFTEAYNKAIELGLMDADDVVELKLGIPSQAEFYSKGYDFLTKCWTAAVEGTPLEGKLKFSKDDTIANNFSKALKTNQVDVLFGVGWTGAALDPYSLVNAYTDPAYQYDPGINYTNVTKAIKFDSIVDVDGKEWKDVTLVASVDAWSNKALAGVDITCAIEGTDGETVIINAGTEAPLEMRTKILCAIEAAILEQYTMLPLDDDASAALKGKKVQYYTEEYVYGVGRGGIKYMTYNYNDAEWAKYVASLGGVIDYTLAE